MKNLIQEGDVIAYPVPAGVIIKAGDVVEVGDLIGVAVDTGIGDNGDVISVNLEGVYSVLKAMGAGTDSLQGAKLYFDPATKLITPDATAPHVFAGWSFADSLAADATVLLRLKTS